MPLAAMVVAAWMLQASPGTEPPQAPPLEVRDARFDRAGGALTFTLVNTATVAVTAFVVEIRTTREHGEETLALHTEDMAGMAAVAGIGPKVPADMLPIAPDGRRTLRQVLHPPSVVPGATATIAEATARVSAVLLADGAAWGNAEQVKGIRAERSARAAKLAEYVAVLEAVSAAGARDAILAALDRAVEGHPGIADWLAGTRAQLAESHGDPRQLLGNLIALLHAQRKAVAEGR